MDPLLAQALGPVVVALAVFALHRWGGVFRRIPRAYLPLLAAVLGAGINAGAALLDRWGIVVGQGDLDLVRAAIEGAIGYGLAGAGAWSATAFVRKRGRS